MVLSQSPTSPVSPKRSGVSSRLVSKGPEPSDTATEQLAAGTVGEEAMNYMLEVAWESDRMDALVRNLLDR